MSVRQKVLLLFYVWTLWRGIHQKICFTLQVKLLDDFLAHKKNAVKYKYSNKVYNYSKMSLFKLLLLTLTLLEHFAVRLRGLMICKT